MIAVLSAEFDKGDEMKLARLGISVDVLKRKIKELDEKYSESLTKFYQKLSEYILMLSSSDMIEPPPLEELKELTDDYSGVYSLLENLNDTDYKHFWIERTRKTLDMFIRFKDDFIKLLRERERSNPLLEHYYQMFLDVLAHLLKDLELVDTFNIRAKDNVPLTKKVHGINWYLFYFLSPIALYLKSGINNYNTVAIFATILIELDIGFAPPLPMAHSEDFLRAFFGD
ncbi:hypothetical protein L3N51_00506 [Metallosphaera sp. J1]|uniref:hypothetical protein n=1 Tax=Metallosphaera javensis (ex Hofmann et al. 2022) TaxID=99938 RepID=UPI001EDF6148|nr:hypothetical protein [Metallosphaera javensis (ex Hofmann et al. 2022)]MCG3108225.1 hypothetical protein [Metallosphaera javensis (ex Hofmann et al. 2022)]